MEFQPNIDQGKREYRERDAEQGRLDHLRDTYYEKEFGSSDVFHETSAEFVIGNLTTIQLASGSAERCRWTCVKPVLWRSGLSRLDMWWFTDGTNTSAVDVDVYVFGWEEDLVVTTTGVTTLHGDTTNFAPDGVANKMFKTSIDIETSITDDMKILGGYFEMVGAEGNPDEFYIAAFRLVFLPNNRQ